jgi:meiotic recombination protein REC8
METDIYQIPADHMDVDLPILGDDLPEGEAFSSVGQHQTSEHSEQVQSTSTVSAPMRQRRRVVRIVPTDRQVELPNKELAAWNTNYLQNMKTATRQKLQGKATQQAKKNAEHYVWGGGLGGIGEDLLGTSGSHPFDMFTGDNFFELVTGVSRKKLAGKKHDRDSGIDDATQGESRSVRQKTGESENQLGRGMEDEGFFMPGGDEVDVELPREGATALDDEQIFSAMPWNISASKRGSSVVPQSGISGRLGMTGSIDQGKRGSRIISASPLLGRGQPSALDALRSLESDADHGYSGDDFALPEPSSEFPEPPAAPQTPTRVREALSAEGENFLTFVAEAIAEKRTRARADLELEADPLQAEAAADIEDVTFAELLSPADNTKVVACQGLMMVLGLGTKGMLDVQQLEHFGDISLKLSAKAKAAQVIEISDGVESDNEDTEDEPDNEEAGEEGEMRGQEGTRNEGHFEEQFAAGHTARGDDDHDSLYDD